MKTSIVFLAIIACALGNPLPGVDDGMETWLERRSGMIPMNERIVGGQPTTIEAFPWIATMQRFGSHHCGACIISPTRLLSAAHCTYGHLTSTIQIRAGSTNSQGPAGQFVQPTHIFDHPQYNEFTLNNDITVLWIPALNTALPGISTIGLPAQNAGIATGAMAHVAGWGALCFLCAGTDMLRYVGVPIVSNAQCSQNLPGLIFDFHVCAGFPNGGYDACQADSGGPLSLGGLLVGVVSWGVNCALPGFPGIYARVAYYRNWIDSVV